MEFLHIYLLLAAAIGSVAAILITKIIGKSTILDSGSETYIQKYVKKLSHDLERSRTGITVPQYFVLKIGAPALLAFVSYFISDDRTLMLIFILLGFMMPDILVKLRKGSENMKFETRFVRALSQMASSLHSGMTVEQAIDSVVNCELLHKSVREDFQLLSSKMKLGIPISQAFYEFAEITESKDAKDVATAITIMTDVGGDAGVAIEKIQKNIEDRLLYRKKRESMMTESRLIVIVSDIMPLLILTGIYVFMPGAIQSFFESGMMMVIFIGIIALLLVGSIVVHKMLSDKIDAT